MDSFKALKPTGSDFVLMLNCIRANLLASRPVTLSIWWHDKAVSTGSNHECYLHPAMGTVLSEKQFDQNSMSNYQQPMNRTESKYSAHLLLILGKHRDIKRIVRIIPAKYFAHSMRLKITKHCCHSD